ncbi:MAG: DUF1905 domain-containing protein [Bacteroidetes bacterium]|nr:MAG: DUF1905 domain-containing protein [Bacteroidota bacterium]
MKTYKIEKIIGQLEKRKGGYFFLKVDAQIVETFKNKRNTRLICKLDNILSFQCGLNHLGDGNFFIIVSTKNLKAINRKVGETIQFEIKEDPNPLGIDIPETIEVLLEQDPELKDKFHKFTDGKKRSIIVQTSKIKDIDKQIARTIELINNPTLQKHKAK